MTPSPIARVDRFPAWTYPAKVYRVVDGDTIDLLVDLGFDVHSRIRVRVAGVNTPEVRGPERARGLESKALVQTWLPVGSEVVVRSYKGKRSFSRWVGDVAFMRMTEPAAGDEPEPKQFDLAIALIEAGAGEKSDG